MSANIHTALGPQVKKLLSRAGVKIRTYEELKLKMNFSIDTIQNNPSIFKDMETKKALHINDMNLIAIDDNSLNSTEDANELVLHELIHMTANKLNRKYEGEAGEQTEECVAQIGMFKLVLVLGLNPAPYADSTLEYIKQFPKANFKKVDADSDKAVDYLVKFVGLERVA
jgi:hypothetical protein